MESCVHPRITNEKKSGIQMPRKKGTGGTPAKRPIDRYEHRDKKRINNPPEGLVTPETDPVAPTHETYDYLAPVPSVKLLRYGL
jgi:hypothetical protein